MKKNLPGRGLTKLRNTDLWTYDVTCSTGMAKPRMESDIQLMWKRL